MLDEEIIGLIYSKNEKGLLKLKEKYQDTILMMIKTILKKEDDIKRCLDNTYKKIIMSIPPYVPKYLRAFILRCAREEAIKIYKETNTKPLNELDVDLVSEFNSNDKLFVDELLNRINVFIDKLHYQDSIIFLRRYLLNEETRVIAQKLEINEDKVKDRINKITEILFNFLKENGYEV